MLWSGYKPHDANDAYDATEVGNAPDFQNVSEYLNKTQKKRFQHHLSTIMSYVLEVYIYGTNMEATHSVLTLATNAKI